MGMKPATVITPAKELIRQNSPYRKTDPASRRIFEVPETLLLWTIWHFLLVQSLLNSTSLATSTAV